MAQEHTTSTGISISVDKSRETGLWDAGIVVHGLANRAEALMAASAIQDLLTHSLNAVVMEPAPPLVPAHLN
jgi:hypothetical protein